MDGTVKCPHCGEEIRAEATRCRYCRSLLVSLDPARWHRDHAERRVAGVASAVAHGLAVPLGAVQLGFLVLTFVHFLGPILYGALWILIPFAPGEEPVLARGLAKAQHLFAHTGRNCRGSSSGGHGGATRAPDGSAGAGSAGVPEGSLP